MVYFLSISMNANDVIKLLRDSIRAAKEAGTDTLLIKRLEAFTTEINDIAQESPTGNALTEAELERYKAKLSAWVGSRQHEHEWDLEMLRSVITTGQSALKSSLLITVLPQWHYSHLSVVFGTLIH